MLFKTKPCAVCAEKDKRIEDLKAQIASLSQMLQPQRLSKQAEKVDLEANVLLNGVNEQVQVSEELSPEVLREREQLLSGTY